MLTAALESALILILFAGYGVLWRLKKRGLEKMIRRR